MKTKDISPHWFWLPFGLVVAQLIARHLLSDEQYWKYFGTESGVIELVTPVVLLPAIVIGIKLMLNMRQYLPTNNSRIWMGMVTLGAFYMAGEEVSWGQWLFYWDTPETFSAINDQNETNLHNTSSLFDQKPRLLLELWVLAGAFRAWYMSAKGKQDDAGTTAYWFWPTLPLAWIGLLSAVVMMPERMRDWWDIVPPMPFNIRVTETQELVLGVYLSLFLASAYTRLKSLKGGA
jgi:hypothetical protein